MAVYTTKEGGRGGKAKYDTQELAFKAYQDCIQKMQLHVGGGKVYM